PVARPPVPPIIFARSPPCHPHLSPPPAVNQIVAVAADEHVVAVAAGDGVVARAAIDGERDERGQAIAPGEGVVAAVHVDDQVLGGADVDEERSGTGAVEADTRAVGSGGY